LVTYLDKEQTEMRSPQRTRIHACEVDTCLELISGKWKPLILWKLSQHSAMRFGEFQRAIPDITKKMLAQQLRELERDQLVTRTIYATVPPKVEYALSGFGQTLRPVLEATAHWGQQYKQQIASILSEQESAQSPGNLLRQ
jgi:DNA-binding HxlR family transcriptional regulator